MTTPASQSPNPMSGEFRLNRLGHLAHKLDLISKSIIVADSDVDAGVY